MAVHSLAGETEPVGDVVDRYGVLLGVGEDTEQRPILGVKCVASLGEADQSVELLPSRLVGRPWWS